MHPESTAYREGLSTWLISQGKDYDEIGQPRNAEEAFNRAVEAAETLIAAHPKSTTYRANLATGLANLGLLHRSNGLPEKAENAYARGVQAFEALAHGASRIRLIPV